MRLIWLINFIGLVGLIVLIGWPYFVSGLQPDGSVIINGSLDALWHLSLIAESAKYWPLQFPGMHGVALTNYHFLSDLVWGLVSKISGLSNLTIYFRVAPIIAIGLVLTGVYKLAQSLSSSKSAPYWAVIFVVFSGSAAFFLPAGYASSFGPDHFLDQSINIHTLLGYAAMLWGLYFWFKKEFKYQFVSGLILGTLFALKSFFFIPVVLGLAVSTGVIFLKSKQLKVIPLVLAGLIMVFAWSVIKGPSSTSPLVFSPGWLSLKVIEEPNRFYQPDWLLRLQVYRQAHNFLRIGQIYFQATLVSIIGGVWLLCLGFLEIPLTLGIICLISLLLPFGIVPNPDNFNAVQFFQPAIILLSISLGILVSKRPAYLGIVLLVFLMPTTFLELINPGHYHDLTISPQETEGLLFIKTHTPQDAIILAQPDSHIDLLKIPAIGDRDTFVSGEKSADLIGADYTSRKNLQDQMLTHKIPLPLSISYVFMQKDFVSLPEWLKDKSAEIVFENSKFIIFANGNNLRTR